MADLESAGPVSGALSCEDAPAYRSEEEIRALVAAFEDTSLPQARWTHAAHLTVAIWYLSQWELPEATQAIRAGIQKYNAAHGVLMTKDSGYHETITLFWIRMVSVFLSAASERELLALANAMLREYQDKRLPMEYYTRERLMSWEARSGWMEPDLKPLPERT